MGGGGGGGGGGGFHKLISILYSFASTNKKLFQYNNFLIILYSTSYEKPSWPWSYGSWI